MGPFHAKKEELIGQDDENITNRGVHMDPKSLKIKFATHLLVALSSQVRTTFMSIQSVTSRYSLRVTTLAQIAKPRVNDSQSRVAKLVCMECT